MERWLVLSVTCTHAVIRTRSRIPGQKDSNASSSWTRADLGKGAGKRNVLVLQDHGQSGSLGLHLPSVRWGATPLWHPTWLVNPSEDMIQRPSTCQMYRTFQEDIFLLLNLRTAPQNPESIKSTEGAEREALSFPPGPRRLPAYLSVRLPLSLPRQHGLQAPLTLW